MCKSARTPGEVRKEFSRLGISVSAWARAHGYSVPLVYQVLSGKRKGIRGESHQIAVALKLKEGAIGGVSDLFSEEHRETGSQVSQGDSRGIDPDSTQEGTERRAKNGGNPMG